MKHFIDNEILYANDLNDIVGEVTEIKTHGGLTPEQEAKIAEIDKKANTTFVQQEIDKLERAIPSLDGYATESWVEEQGYLTEHQDISNLATKSELATVKDIAEGAHRASVFSTVADVCSSLDAASKNDYNVGDNIYIKKIEVADLWVSEVHSTSITYEYESDFDFYNIIDLNGSIRVGYFSLSKLETEKVYLNEYATKEWVEEQGYLTEHQSLVDYAKKSEIPTKLSELDNDAGYAKALHIKFILEHPYTEPNKLITVGGETFEEVFEAISNGVLVTAEFNNTHFELRYVSEGHQISFVKSDTNTNTIIVWYPEGDITFYDYVLVSKYDLDSYDYAPKAFVEDAIKHVEITLNAVKEFDPSTGDYKDEYTTTVSDITYDDAEKILAQKGVVLNCNIANVGAISLHAHDIQKVPMGGNKNILSIRTHTFNLEQSASEFKRSIFYIYCNYQINESTKEVTVYTSGVNQYIEPTKVSQLTNDAGYLTQHQDISGKQDKGNMQSSLEDSTTQYPSSRAVINYVSPKLAFDRVITDSTRGYFAFQQKQNTGFFKGTVKGVNSFAFGELTDTNNQNEVAFGKANVSKNVGSGSNTLFTIGVGSGSTDRKNAVEITQSGNQYVIGVGGFDGKTTTGAKTLQDTILDKADKSEIPSLEGYATKQYVNDKVDNISAENVDCQISSDMFDFDNVYDGLNRVVDKIEDMAYDLVQLDVKLGQIDTVLTNILG